MKPYFYKGLREKVGLSSTDYQKLYQAWLRMIHRCCDSNYASYHRYGGRGIAICTEWKYSFENFLTWSLENGWKSNLSLDRIDNDNDYCPSNCRWVTSKIQARNRSTCVYLTHNGETKSLIEWCEIYGVPHYLPSNRLRRGCTDFEQLFVKIDNRTGGELHY